MRRDRPAFRRVAEANPRAVVVVNSGAPVLLPWSEQVAAGEQVAADIAVPEALGC